MGRKTLFHEKKERMSRVTISRAENCKLQKVRDRWINHEAEPNGIGPVCLFCDRLIDWSPRDHSIQCPVRMSFGFQGAE